MKADNTSPLKPNSQQLYGTGQNGGKAAITLGGRGNKAWITENGVTKPIDLKEASRHVSTASVPMSERPSTKPVPSRYTKNSAVTDNLTQKKAAPKGEMVGSIEIKKGNGYYKFYLPDGYSLFKFKVTAESRGEALPDFDLEYLTNINEERSLTAMRENVFTHPLKFGEGFMFKTKDGHEIDLSKCKVTEFVSEQNIKGRDGSISKAYNTKQTLIVDDKSKTVYMIPGSVAYQRPEILA